MNTKDLQIYKVIGEVHSRITESKTFKQAVQNSLKVLTENKFSDYAIIWIKHSDGTFRPVYWLCPFDLTSEVRGQDSLVSKSLETNEPQIFSNSSDKSNKIASINEEYESFVSPISLVNQGMGCIEFIKLGKFNEEEKDAFQVLTMLLEVEINTNSPLVDVNEDKEVILSLKDIKKSFKNGETMLQVLKGINFNVYKGEFLCLLGESGCGKSTILNIIGGLIPADSGSLKFKDQELVGCSTKELTKYRRDNIGFIFQQYNLMPNLTAVQNVKLIAELAKDSMDEIEALKMVNLEEKANSYPSMLSGGQQQRISIARALVKKPKLVLADEPTAALDYETSIEVLSVFEKVMETGSTLVVVTHNEEIAKMANRVIRFRQGQVYEISVNLHPAKATDLKW